MPAPRVASELPQDVLDELNRRLRNHAISYASIARWLHERGWKMSEFVVRTYAIGARLRRPTRRADLKVELLLTPAHLKEYEDFLDDLRHNQCQAERWLHEKGYQIGATAVRKHRLRHLEAFDRVRNSAKVAKAVVELAADKGGIVMAEGAATLCEQAVFEQLMRVPEGAQFDPQALAEHLQNVTTAMKSRHTFEQIRAAYDKTQRQAISAGQEAASKGASGKDVVLRMKEILGV